MMSLIPLLRRLPFWLWSLMALASVSAQTPKTSPTPDEPKSIVKGRVVYDDTNDPVRRSRISLMQLPERPSDSLTSATDRDGKFEIWNVPAGVYFVMLDSPGIINPIAFLKFTENSEPEAVDLKEMKEYCTQVTVDGTNNVELKIRARRGGVIAGKVTYADGAPAVHASMSIFKRRGKQMIPVISGLSVGGLLSLRTDDRGQYRLSGLPPGTYFLAAAENNTSPSQYRRRYEPFSDLIGNDALIVSYYGNSTKLSDALPLEVGLASQINDIDIVLADSTPHTISGSIIAKSDGRSLANAGIKIRNKEQANWFSRDQQQTMRSDENGQWVLEGVPDGTYVISVEPGYELARPSSSDEGDERPQPVSRKVLPKETEVTVAGSDVAGVVIELIDGATVSGTIDLTSVSEADQNYVSVNYAYEGERSAGSFINRATVSGGKFSIEPLKPGRVYLNAQIGIGGVGPDDRPKYYVKSIMVNGVDLLQKPLAIEAGQTITNVRIVIGTDTAQCKVQLNDSKGKPLPARQLMIVSVDPGKWSFSEQSMTSVTDANGMVTFSGAPGDYVVIVPKPDDSWPPSTDEIRAALQTGARIIKLKAGDNKTISLTVN